MTCNEQRESSEVPRGLASRLVWWPVAILATSIGLLPITQLGLIQDDLVVLAEGLNALWAGSPIVLFDSLLSSLTTGGHFLPVGALATTVQVALVSALASSPFSVSGSWELLRVLWIVAALVMAANGIASWLRALDAPGKSKASASPLAIYSMLAGITLVCMQIHGLWSSDPVLSYPLASWLTTGLGFLYAGCLAMVWRGSGTTSWRWAAIALVVGGAGVLTYEAMAAAIAAGGAAILLMSVAHWVRVGWSSVAWPLVLAVLAPSAIFALSQWVRLQLPGEYEGTQYGHVEWILPVTTNGLAGALPLANRSLTDVYAQGVSVNWASVLTVVFAAVCLIVLAGALYRSEKVPSVRAPVATLGLVVFLLGFWTASTAMFSASLKYQMIIGITLGNTYLFYAVALIVLSTLVTLGLLRATSRFGSVSLAIILPLVVALGVWQWSINSRSLDKIAVDFAWTEELVNSLEGGSTIEERCASFARVDPAHLPEWYASALADGIQGAYLGRYGEVYCPDRP